MSNDPLPSETAPIKQDDTKARAGRPAGRGMLIILGMLAALTAGAAVYLIVKWVTIEKEMDRLNAISAICKETLEEECARIRKHSPRVDGYWKWACNFETGGDYELIIFDRPREANNWVDLHITTKYKEPLEFENCGGKETAEVISRIKAKIVQAGISVKDTRTTGT